MSPRPDAWVPYPPTPTRVPRSSRGQSPDSPARASSSSPLSADAFGHPVIGARTARRPNAESRRVQRTRIDPRSQARNAAPTTESPRAPRGRTPSRMTSAELVVAKIWALSSRPRTLAPGRIRDRDRIRSDGRAPRRHERAAAAASSRAPRPSATLRWRGASASAPARTPIARTDRADATYEERGGRGRGREDSGLCPRRLERMRLGECAMRSLAPGRPRSNSGMSVLSFRAQMRRRDVSAASRPAERARGTRARPMNCKYDVNLAMPN